MLVLLSHFIKTSMCLLLGTNSDMRTQKNGILLKSPIGVYLHFFLQVHSKFARVLNH